MMHSITETRYYTSPGDVVVGGITLCTTGSLQQAWDYACYRHGVAQCYIMDGTWYPDTEGPNHVHVYRYLGIRPIGQRSRVPIPWIRSLALRHHEHPDALSVYGGACSIHYLRPRSTIHHP